MVQTVVQTRFTKMFFKWNQEHFLATEKLCYNQTLLQIRFTQMFFEWNQEWILATEKLYKKRG